MKNMEGVRVECEEKGLDEREREREALFKLHLENLLSHRQCTLQHGKRQNNLGTLNTDVNNI